MQNYIELKKKKKTTLNIRIYLHYLRILLRMCLSLKPKRTQVERATLEVWSTIYSSSLSKFEFSCIVFVYSKKLLNVCELISK